MGTDPARAGALPRPRPWAASSWKTLRRAGSEVSPPWMGGGPKRCVCFREAPGSERQKEESREPRGLSLHPGPDQGALVPAGPARAARATCCGESPPPALGTLSSPRAARLSSASLTEVHLSSRVASQLGSAELGPVMIKPTANGASRRVHTLWWPGAHLNLGTRLAGTCG